MAAFGRGGKAARRDNAAGHSAVAGLSIRARSLARRAHRRAQAGARSRSQSRADPGVNAVHN